jgi:hypothetical protein
MVLLGIKVASIKVTVVKTRCLNHTMYGLLTSYFTDISRIFHGYSRIFHGCFTDISRIFHGYFTDISRIFHGYFTNVYGSPTGYLRIFKLSE